MPIPSIGPVLGVDWGTVRIGIAVSDETQLLASPLDTLVRRPGKRFPMPSLLVLIEPLALVGIVVGLPLTLEGIEGESAQAARQLANSLGRRTGLPIELWDERVSTARALGAIREQDGSTRGRKAEVDALAATVLLQHWLDVRRAGRRAASSGSD